MNRDWRREPRMPRMYREFSPEMDLSDFSMPMPMPMEVDHDFESADMYDDGDEGVRFSFPSKLPSIDFFNCFEDDFDDSDIN
ncbi:unnamed protein product [Thlaspi arvense]|uniref:Uncharacterized protein n=1 Tax=Thlaspi arvense TaxID=13288 RepID=A0AAU9T731_THLAR|nr:unnamed protein product [Thlaspi arvense]